MTLLPPELISLDIWHTLIVPNPQFKVLQVELFADFLGVKPDSTFQAIVKQVDEWAYQKSLLGKDTSFEERIEQISSLLPQGNVSLLLDVEKLYQDMELLFLHYAPLLIEKDLTETLQIIRQKGIQIALLSNTGFIKGQTMRKFLKNSQILAHVDIAIFSNEVGICKPHPQIFELLIQRVSNRAKLWHVGDSYEADYIGAVNMGLQAFLLQNSRDNLNFAINIQTTPSIQFLLNYL
ncbi:MAG: HAD family hydrolase [Microscillaceae bacterium]|nr:HAD family hydrolase [Microscillaceae bacterium]MDW8461439.1 HAD family hydrolase [Cytophagales bacterium]